MLIPFIFASMAAAVDVLSCFWPDGSLDTSGYVCNITAVQAGGASPCCLHNDACYESGSCLQDWSGVTYRQSCTDSTWKDPSCPQMCLTKGPSSKRSLIGMGDFYGYQLTEAVLADKLYESVWIQQCNISNATACCVDGDPCCGDPDNFFEWKPGYITAVINGDGSNRLGPYIAADANSSSSSSIPTAATSTPSPSSVRASSSVLSSSSPSSTDKSKTDRIVAIAIGVVLGVISLIALAGMLVFWRKYKAERRMRMAAEEKTQMQAGGQQYLYHQYAPLPVHPTELSAMENTRIELPVKNED